MTEQLVVISTDATLRSVANDYDGIKDGVDHQIFDFVQADKRLGFYIQDEGMLTGQPLNVVASMMAQMALWGPAVLCRGETDGEGNTLPPSDDAVAFAALLAQRWRNVIAYAAHSGQTLSIIPDADTIPPPQVIPLPDDWLPGDPVPEGGTVLIPWANQARAASSGGPPHDAPEPEGDQK